MLTTQVTPDLSEVAYDVCSVSTLTGADGDRPIQTTISSSIRCTIRLGVGPYASDHLGRARRRALPSTQNNESTAMKWTRHDGTYVNGPLKIEKLSKDSWRLWEGSKPIDIYWRLEEAKQRAVNLAARAAARQAVAAKTDNTPGVSYRGMSFVAYTDTGGMYYRVYTDFQTRSLEAMFDYLDGYLAGRANAEFEV